MIDYSEFISRNGTIWLQPLGITTSLIYLGSSANLLSINESEGQVEFKGVMDHKGGWRSVATPGAPPVKISITIDEKIFNNVDLDIDRGPFNLYISLRSGGEPDVLYNFSKMLIISDCYFISTEEKDVSHSDWKKVYKKVRKIEGCAPVIRVKSMYSEKQTNTGTVDLNDIVTYGNTKLIQSKEGNRLFAVGEQAFYDDNMLGSINGGNSWVKLDAPYNVKNIRGTLALQKSESVTRLLIGYPADADDSQGYISYSDDLGATWTNVALGESDEGHGLENANALFAYGNRKIWLGSKNGQIFFSSDNGESWESQTSSLITDKKVLSIFFVDKNNGIAGLEGDTILITQDGGSTWVKTENATGTPVDIQTVGGDSFFWWIGTDDGQLYYGLRTALWFTMCFPPQYNTGEIKHIYFLNDFLGYMIRNVNSRGKLFFTINGGFSWKEIPTQNNSGFNRLLVVNETLMYVVGNAHNGTSCIIKVS